MSDALDPKLTKMQQLYARRLRINGALEQQIATGQRRLPRKLRKDAQSVAKALSLLDHPKLARQVDTTRVLTAVDRVNAHLATIDPRDRLWVRIVNVLAWVLLAVVAAGFAYALYLRFLG